MSNWNKSRIEDITHFELKNSLRFLGILCSSVFVVTGCQDCSRDWSCHSQTFCGPIESDVCHIPP